METPQTDLPAPETEQAPAPENPIQDVSEEVPQSEHLYRSDPETLPTTNIEPLAWTAPEFIAHAKTASWYAILGLCSLALAALIWLITKDVISAVVVVVGALFLGVYAGRKPRELDYQISISGIGIGAKHYGYEEFKSFAIVPEETTESIVFMPLKRFAPSLTIYYATEHENQIVDFLAARLPLEEYKHDLVDNFVRKIRF